jgi:glutathione S-transferase
VSSLPILYSFRRCPYAIRARMALLSSGLTFEIREVLLRDKPTSMLTYSPKGTVPVLVLPDGRVIDESLDVMKWALQQSDPDGWLNTPPDSAREIDRLMKKNDGEFKSHLDRYKYSTRYEDADPQEHRNAAEQFLIQLNTRLTTRKYLVSDHPSLVDIALFPFIRQFANADREWFDTLDYQPLQNWLEGFLSSERFTEAMRKFPRWQPEDPQTLVRPALP